MQNSDSNKKSQIPLLLLIFLAILLSFVCVSSATLLAISTGNQNEIGASMLAQSNANYQRDQNAKIFGQLNPEIILEATHDADNLLITPIPMNMGDAIQNFASTAVAQIFPTPKPTTLPAPIIATLAPEVLGTAVSVAPIPTQSQTATPSFTSTTTATPHVATNTPTVIATNLATWTATPRPTLSATATNPPVNTPVPATNTPIPANTATFTPSPTQINTAVPTNTPLATTTSTSIPTATATTIATSTPTQTSTATVLPTSTATATATPSPTATATNMPPSNEVLFVVGDKDNMNGTDMITALAFITKGFTVTTSNDGDTNAADTIGKAVVYISSSIDATQIGNRLRDISVPMIVADSDLFDDMALTGATVNTDYGQSANDQDSIAILDDTHALAAGLTGTVQVYFFPNHLNWGAPSAEAIVIAELTDGSISHTAIFAYENGSQMVGVPAPARRVAFFHDAENGAALTISNGWALFDAAVNWAIGP